MTTSMTPPRNSKVYRAGATGANASAPVRVGSPDQSPQPQEIAMVAKKTAVAARSVFPFAASSAPVRLLWFFARHSPDSAFSKTVFAAVLRVLGGSKLYRRLIHPGPNTAATPASGLASGTLIHLRRGRSLAPPRTPSAAIVENAPSAQVRAFLRTAAHAHRQRWLRRREQDRSLLARGQLFHLGRGP